MAANMKRSLIFGFNCYLAGIAALFIAFCFDLPNPWWALITVFLTSQAGHEGGIWAKAAFRLGGTILGLCATLLIVPNLVDEPELLLVALAAWLGICLFIALLDRTPRGYLPMLAGYTAILVGLPLIDDPSNIFDAAVARTEEILLGVACASLAHGLVFPRSLHKVIVDKSAACLGDAITWAGNALDMRSGRPDRRSRLAFAGAVVELATLATSLGFETPRAYHRVALARTLSQRLASLLPIVDSVEDRLWSLHAQQPDHPYIESTALRVKEWIASGSSDTSEFHAVLACCHSTDLGNIDASDWRGFSEIGVLNNLDTLIRAWYDCCRLFDALCDPAIPLSPELLALIARNPRLSLHLDVGIAAWSGFTAALAVLATGGIALAVKWPPATITIGITAVFCSLFATLDDPTPLLRRMIVWALISVPLGFIYIFFVLPAADDFAMLALVLFPLIAVPAAFMANPSHMLRGLTVAIITTLLVNLQSSYHGDLETFANLAIASIFGLLAALVITQEIRVLDATTVAKRIVRAGWRDLARMASDHGAIPVAVFSMRMLDRVGLLVPRLKPGSQDIADTLLDLRTGVDVSELLAIRTQLDLQGQQNLDHFRWRLARHCMALARRSSVKEPPLLDEYLDQLRPAILALSSDSARNRAITALTGLRLDLHTALVSRMAI